MGNKERKFFEQLLIMSKFCEQYINQVQKVSENQITEEYAEVISCKQKIRKILPKIYQKASKAYESPLKYTLAVKIIDNLYFSIEYLNDVLQQMQIYPIEEKPKNIEDLENIIKCSFVELIKILQYSDNIEDAYMKIKARINKVLEYEKRGNGYYLETLKNLYSSEKETTYIMRWKKIIENFDFVLNKSIESVVILESLF